jgi:hypothetical protein
MPSAQHPASAQSLEFAPGWSIEIDPAGRKLTIWKASLLSWLTTFRWQTVYNDCTFDECSSVGTVPTKYDSEAEIVSFGVYLDFRAGREVIPAGSLVEASRLASELSAATGIPRHDVKNWHPWFDGPANV